MIQHATINNLAFGRSVEETIRTLQAIQYVQENPEEVCPAGESGVLNGSICLGGSSQADCSITGWKPGDVTMNPDPKKSKEYFAAL